MGVRARVPEQGLDQAAVLATPDTVHAIRTSRPMTFMLYAELDRDSIADALGRPDYSYFFVLDGFRSALQNLGRIVLVREPSEVDALYDDECRAGRDCVFLCFTPPHKAPVRLRCPTVCVFAWEFSNIPDEALDEDPRSDWRSVFAAHGWAITLSEHAAATVRAAMGADFPVSVVAVALPERLAIGGGGLGTRVLSLRGSVYDSRGYGPYLERPPWVPPPPEPEPAAVIVPEPPPPAAPRRSPLRTSIGVSRYYGLRWYREAIRDPLLPRPAIRALSRAGQAAPGVV